MLWPGVLGVRPSALTLPHVLAWRTGVVIAIVDPQSKCDKIGLIVVSLNCRKTMVHCQGFSTLTPQTVEQYSSAVSSRTYHKL